MLWNCGILFSIEPIFDRIGHLTEKNMKKNVTSESSLLDILQEMAPESSKNTLRSWIQVGRVTVDNRRVIKANELIKVGQEVVIGHKMHFAGGGLRIIHEDESIVVVEKPEGLLSVATDFETKATVHAMLKRRFFNKKVFPVHRLDRETSGVMIFAYSEDAKEHLKSQFEERKVDKVYYAIVENAREIQKGTWESFLEEDDFYYVKSSTPERGKNAVTQYEPIKTSRGSTLLKLNPLTGRKNQLRVHCSEAGYPIVGDKKYGSHYNPIRRLALHAQKITFTHPKSGRKVSYAAPLPESFYKLVPVEL